MYTILNAKFNYAMSYVYNQDNVAACQQPTVHCICKRAMYMHFDT
eukprot:COSAG02_NODE_8393_length_2587_cov_1.414791_4_plen_44_part_01